ncbi:MAG TPA: response regulator transcription factor [Nocardioidaceae bacterium]|nr:response regulator transcription factor [Nocardioidaceae bacterium]
MTVSRLLLITGSTEASVQVLPALSLLPHVVQVVPAEPTMLLDIPAGDAVLVDGRSDLAAVRSLCRLIKTTGITVPLLLVVSDVGLAVVAADWGIDDVVLATAGPAEVEARLRLAIGRSAVESDLPATVVRGDLEIDEASYLARVSGKPLDLTFKEFELLKFLAQHPGRVFSRQQLLAEVWGYDYLGGTRTVDVHVRRVRAKLGTEHESLVGTVRNVGYRFVPPTQRYGGRQREPMREQSSPAGRGR